jgi:hypothetical protein
LPYLLRVGLKSQPLLIFRKFFVAEIADIEITRAEPMHFFAKKTSRNVTEVAVPPLARLDPVF